MKFPPGILSEPGREPSGWWNELCVNRDGGTGVYVLRLESKASRNDEVLLMEPGNRQAIPMMAMGGDGSWCDGTESIFAQAISAGLLKGKTYYRVMLDTVFWDLISRKLRPMNKQP